MKLDKIYSIYRKAAHLTLYNRFEKDGTISAQSISDGASLFILDNLPIFDEHTLPSLLGIDSDTVNIGTMSYDHDNGVTSMTAETDETDIPLTILPYEFFDSLVFKSLNANDEQVVHFANPAYIKPFANDGRITFWSRFVADGRCIIIKNGIFIVGAVMPMRFTQAADKYIEMVRLVYGELMMESESKSDEK